MQEESIQLISQDTGFKWLTSSPDIALGGLDDGGDRRFQKKWIRGPSRWICFFVFQGKLFRRKGRKDGLWKMAGLVS
jgi:hypothetical protein